MLDELLRPRGFGSLDRESWESYRRRLGLPDDRAETQFYRQVVYDHFDLFNEDYPWFDINRCEYNTVSLEASYILRDVRYFNNESLSSPNFWHGQFDYFFEKGTEYDYLIFREMMLHRTFPFPPIILNFVEVNGPQGRLYGRPLHLIEGTHRVSYLTRMLELGLIADDSLHGFVLIQPIPLAENTLEEGLESFHG